MRLTAAFSDTILTRRYVLVCGQVYRIRSVDSMALATEGWASLQGAGVFACAAEERDREVTRLRMLSDGIPEEDVATHFAALQAVEASRRIQEASLAMSSVEGQSALTEREKAFVCAAVDGMGLLDVEAFRKVSKAHPLEYVGLLPLAFDPTEYCVDLSKAMEDYEPSEDTQEPHITACRVVQKVPQKAGETAEDAIRRLHDSGDIWFDAMNKAQRRAIYVAATQVADGQARSAAAFRFDLGPKGPPLGGTDGAGVLGPAVEDPAAAA